MKDMWKFDFFDNKKPFKNKESMLNYFKDNGYCYAYDIPKDTRDFILKIEKADKFNPKFDESVYLNKDDITRALKHINLTDQTNKLNTEEISLINSMINIVEHGDAKSLVILFKLFCRVSVSNECFSTFNLFYDEQNNIVTSRDCFFKEKYVLNHNLPKDLKQSLIQQAKDLQKSLNLTDFYKPEKSIQNDNLSL